MKRILLLVLICFSIVLGYSIGKPFDSLRSLRVTQFSQEPKVEILKIGLVADSHEENVLLAKALWEAKAGEVDFVIGLGDYTNLGKIDELSEAKSVFDESGLEYHLLLGDREGWESREKGLANNTNFLQVFGNQDTNFSKNSIQFVLLDNSDIYKGITPEDWSLLENVKCQISNVKCEESKLTFVFAHKTPFHPDSAHIMGEDSPKVADQAKEFLSLMEATRPCHSEFSSESADNKILNQVQDDGAVVRDDSGEQCPNVDGFFSGDLHFFAQFKSPNQSVRITTIGAVASQRNFQGPRFAILKVYSDYSWEVEDVPIE